MVVPRPDRLTLLLGLVVFTDTFGYAIVVPLLPFAAQEFGAPDLVIGGIFASYSLCQLVAAPLLGSWSDRYGRKPLLLASLLGTAAGFALLVVANSVTLVLLSRLIDGATAGNISIINSTILDRYGSAEWERRFSYLASETGGGILAGLLVSAVLAPRGLAAAAAVALGLSLLSSWFTWRLFPETAGHQAPARAGDAWHRIGAQVHEELVRRGLMTCLVCSVVQACFLLALPLFLARQTGLDVQGSSATIAVLFGLAALFQVAVLPRLVNVLGNRRSVLAGFGLVALGALSLSGAATQVQVLVGGAMAMWGLSSLAPTVTALVARRNPDLERGALMGLNQSITSAGQLLGPPLGYAALSISPTVGYSVACALLALLGLAVTLPLSDRDG
jgi:MFS family permease